PMPAGVTLVDARTLPFDRLVAYDRRFYPAERDAFLAAWIDYPGRTSLAALKDGELAGFGTIREAATGSRIGPLYAASPDIAGALVTALAAARPGRPIALDVPDYNEA